MVHRSGLAPVFVVVSGAPGSGKSTLAVPLAQALGLPLIAKDLIKESLMDSLGVADVEASRRLSHAAMATLFALAGASSPGAVLEGNFRRSQTVDLLSRLPRPVVEVFCRCDRIAAEARFRARATSRHPGHFDEARAGTDLWDDEVNGPLAERWPHMEVDTDSPVDIAAVVAFVDRFRT